jgi:hypothetical protein
MGTESIIHWNRNLVSGMPAMQSIEMGLTESTGFNHQLGFSRQVIHALKTCHLGPVE